MASTFGRGVLAGILVAAAISAGMLVLAAGEGLASSSGAESADYGVTLGTFTAAISLALTASVSAPLAGTLVGVVGGRQARNVPEAAGIGAAAGAIASLIIGFASLLAITMASNGKADAWSLPSKFPLQFLLLPGLGYAAAGCVAAIGARLVAPPAPGLAMANVQLAPPGRPLPAKPGPPQVRGAPPASTGRRLP